MIVYHIKGLFSMDKRVSKMRTSDKHKRVYARISIYRKQWWHFRTRWDPKDSDTD